MLLSPPVNRSEVELNRAMPAMEISPAPVVTVDSRETGGAQGLFIAVHVEKMWWLRQHETHVVLHCVPAVDSILEHGDELSSISYPVHVPCPRATAQVTRGSTAARGACAPGARAAA